VGSKNNVSGLALIKNNIYYISLPKKCPQKYIFQCCGSETFYFCSSPGSGSDHSVYEAFVMTVMSVMSKVAVMDVMPDLSMIVLMATLISVLAQMGLTKP
jgi:hypothetical protein